MELIEFFKCLNQSKPLTLVEHGELIVTMKRLMKIPICKMDYLFSTPYQRYKAVKAYKESLN